MLLAANHVTGTFGEGITPRRYRLSGMDVRMDAERLFGVASDNRDVKLARPVLRPKMSKAPSSATFREDREDRMLLQDRD